MIQYTIVAILFLFLLRLMVVLLPTKRTSNRNPTEKGHLVVFLGSGGHTSEMMQMLRGVDLTRYQPRTYIVSQGDHLSANKAMEFERIKGSESKFQIMTIPRAREVLQPMITVPITASISLLACIRLWTTSISPTADILLLNGPGTCVPLVIAVFISRFLGLASPRVIFVESFTRVKSVSLTGRILRPIVDTFIVQWPKLLGQEKRGEYFGWLI